MTIQSDFFNVAPLLGQPTRAAWSDAVVTLLSPLDRSAAEIAAGVTPTSYEHPPGDMRRYGATGDGVTDDSAAEDAAHLSGHAAIYPSATYASTDSVFNIYGSYTKALYQRIQVGLPGAPTESAEPVVWAQKFSSANRDTNPSEWDQGAGYFQVVKMSGDAYAAGLTGVGRHHGGTGDVIGVHGRGVARHDAARVWGGWFYADLNGSTSYTGNAIGVEIDVNNADDPADFSVPGQLRGLVVATVDGSAYCNIGIDVGAQAGSDGWHTGLRLRADGIAPSLDVGEDTCQLRIEGATTIAGRYGGISFEGDRFEYGINMVNIVEDIDDHAALTFKYDHRLRWGAKDSSRYIHVSSGATTLLDIVNYPIGINGTQVVTTRRTGWGAPTGTPTRTTFATSTVTLPELAERVKALIDDLTTHGLVGA